jgi:hypothetical protein
VAIACSRSLSVGVKLCKCSRATLLDPNSSMRSPSGARRRAVGRRFDKSGPSIDSIPLHRDNADFRDSIRMRPDLSFRHPQMRGA